MNRPLRLDEVSEAIVDCEHKTAPTVDEGIPLIRTADICNGVLNLQGANRITEDVYREWSKRLEPRLGDIILAREAPVGEVGYVPKGQKVCLGQRTVLIRPDPNIVEPRYLLYLLLTQEIKQKLISLSEGSTVPHLNMSEIRKLEIPELPPIPYQHGITELLGAMDDSVELNRYMNTRLEALARAIFKSWFIDFDPVRAKAEGKQPFGMDEEAATLFPSEFDDSELGEIPKGWRSTCISELADLNSYSLGKNDPLDSLKYIEISEVKQGEIGNIQTFRRGEEPSRARRRLRHGDTVISTVRPDRGSYFLCLNPSKNMIASTGFTVVTPKDAPWSFVYEVLTRQQTIEYFGQQADGGAYPAIKPEVIGDIQVAMPENKEILGYYHRIVGPLLELADQNRKQSKTLASIRDALLPKLLSGELRIPDNSLSNLQANSDVSAPTE